MNIASLVYRINNEFFAMNNNNIPYNLWRYYASLDIEAYLENIVQYLIT